MDFHTSEHVVGVGAAFDPEAFATTLKRAQVDSVTVFGRCHHGYIYFDTKSFPERRHPHLARKNLLGEQIEACHKHDIRAPIYITIMWDQFTADEHPDWRQVTATGAFEGRPPYEPGFYRRLCLNTPYADFLEAHLEELFHTVPVDGLFLDIVHAQDCSCVRCRKEMARRGMNAADEATRKAFGREVVDRWKRRLTAFTRKRTKPGTSVFYNGGHVGPTIRPTIETYTHLELESLPSGGWGYLHFPLTARYARTLGPDVMGMTGKFHTSWGDFHSLKNRAALEFECFQMLALNAKCSIGDQLHPAGKLDTATYELIGAVYGSVAAKEPWCRGARALVDIGVLSPEEYTPAAVKNLSPSARGVVRMLQELGHQFDIVDSLADFARYKVMILPDDIAIDPKLADKLSRYLKSGGALLASHKSAEGTHAARLLGVRVKGEAPFSPDFIRPRAKLAHKLPNTELVMYAKALALQPAGAEILADVIVPYFNRTWDKFFSHRHTPSSGKTAEYVGVVRNGRTITFAHPVFGLYTRNAPLWVKQLVANALDLLLPQPLVRHDGPSTLLATLNEQPRERRSVLHLLHYVPERRGDEFDTIEDVLPVHDLAVSVRTGKAPARVAAVPGDRPLAFTFKDGRTTFTIPKLVGHEMVTISA